MKSKDGAILVGMEHHGREAANKVIEFLEQHGLTSGDLVVLEGDKEDSKYARKILKENRFEEELNRFKVLEF